MKGFFKYAALMGALMASAAAYADDERLDHEKALADLTEYGSILRKISYCIENKKFGPDEASIIQVLAGIITENISQYEREGKVVRRDSERALSAGWAHNTSLISRDGSYCYVYSQLVEDTQDDFKSYLRSAAAPPPAILPPHILSEKYRALQTTADLVRRCNMEGLSDVPQEDIRALIEKIEDQSRAYIYPTSDLGFLISREASEAAQELPLSPALCEVLVREASE